MELSSIPQEREESPLNSLLVLVKLSRVGI